MKMALPRDMLKVATCQFENKSGDKKYNLDAIERLSRNAAVDGKPHTRYDRMYYIGTFMNLIGDSPGNIIRVARTYGLLSWHNCCK